MFLICKVIFEKRNSLILIVGIILMLLMVVYVRYVNEDMLKIMNYCVFE